ncbi:hypothetical protein, partial [Nitrosospira sp. NpAV]|uniref:hypothetical protein n=1 Tax=Nitrosospira sp. NpAV TaxID=58133 RepID=UPI0005A07038
SLVLLDVSVDQIMSNLKKRHAELQGKKQNDWLAWLPEEELLEKIREGKERKQRWTKIAQALGVATLELDASEELSVSERKVLDFL